MRTTKKIVSSVLAACMLASTSVVSGFAANVDDSVGATNKYATACEEIDKQYSYAEHDLGATYSPEQTVFKVWSPTATEVKLNRYATGSDSEEGAAKLGTVSMEKLMDGENWTGVWTTTVQGDIVNTYYTYTITSAHPYSKAVQTAETQDVYSVATGVNGKRSMVCDLSKTNPSGWENDTHVLLDKSTESSVWELHVKDFSWDKNSGVSEENRGKFLAFTETGTTLYNEGNLSTCIDYLKDLGITTVQLNPFYDFQSINEAGSDNQFNWGYDPQNYNVPEGSYSSNPYDGNVRIKECKAMIQALHEAGISVVMDVVYNHTYSSGKDDSCFQATVPDYYYRMANDGTFSNGSGCGNEVSSERFMTRDYIIQSVLYWVNEYHVDGFRFDLMGLMDVETMNLLRAALDEVDPRITTWGEGWTGGTSTMPTYTCTGERNYPATQANSKRLNTRMAFFNDAIRDGIKGSVFDVKDKGFIAGTAQYATNIRSGVRANTVSPKGWTAYAPEQTVTYAACHDNATIYDQITLSYTNDELGVRNDKAVKVNKLAAGILYTSQGINFTLAGEEMGRTKFGDTNSYKSSPEINKIRWENIVDYADLISYFKGMMKIKRAFTPLTANDMSYSNNFVFNGAKLTDESGYVAYTIANDQEGEWNKMAVIHNSTERSQNVTLKDTTTTNWVVIANDQEAGLNALSEVKGSTFKVAPQSTLVAVDKEGFEAAGLTENTGKVEVSFEYLDGTQVADSVVLKGDIGKAYVTKPSVSVSPAYVLDSVKGNATGVYTAETQKVTYVYKDAAKVEVNYIYRNGTQLAEPVMLYGNVGDTYTATPSDSVPNTYQVKEVKGGETGVFTEEMQTVTYIYTDYVPQSLYTGGDVDEDGKVTINDVTEFQRIMAEMVTVSDEKYATLDIDYDGTVTVSDITMIQMYLAEMRTSEGSVQVNYYYTDSTGVQTQLTDSVTINGRVGDDFSAPKYYKIGYSIDETKRPKMEKGKIPFGETYVVNYYYVDGNDVDVTLHFKHSGSLTWAPTLWIWGAKMDGTDDTDNYTGGSWPGKKATLNSATGWFDYSFTYNLKATNGFYNVIVSTDGAQTADCKSFGCNEMWVVIDDSNIVDKGNFLTFYDVDPDLNPNATPLAYHN